MRLLLFMLMLLGDVLYVVLYSPWTLRAWVRQRWIDSKGMNHAS